MIKNPLLINRIRIIIAQMAETGADFSTYNIHDIYQQRYKSPIPKPRCVGGAIRGMMDKVEFVRYEKSPLRRGPIAIYRRKPQQDSSRDT